MTPKESLFKELETADEALIAETLSWVRSRKQNLTQALEAARALPTDHQRATALADLAKLDSTHFPEALEAARAVKDLQKRSLSLSHLAKIVTEEQSSQELRSGSELVKFLQESPLSEVADEIDFSRDRTIYPDRISFEAVVEADGPTIVDIIANLRQAIESEGVEINPDEIWGDVRDKTPAPEQPCW